MSLKEIFCQDRAISILQRAFAGDKSPHAYIFAGPEGVGKFKTAREWAKTLLCNNPAIENTFVDSCGLCVSCRLLEAGSHHDYNLVYKELVEFTKEGKGRKTPVEFPIDVVREFVVDKVSNKPILSQRKVFILGEAEKLNTESQNCLLKVLEEPPGYCTIILLCTRLERLLPTIKSRCQMIRFGPVTEEMIIERLREMRVKDKQARYWAHLAQGSLGRACQWARLELVDGNLYEIKKRLLISLSTCKYADALELAGWILDESKRIAAIWADLDKDTSKADINRRAQKTLVQIIISALHDAMGFILDDRQKLINIDQKDQIRLLACRFNPEQLAEIITLCYRTLRQIESSVNEKLIFEQLLLSLAVSDIINI